MKLVTKYQISAINSCWEKCAYMFNVDKNQLSRQTGSRNLMVPKPLPTIWHTYVKHRRLCRVKNMLAMYLKYHKAGLTPTTPVTSIAISPVKMSIGRKSLTNLRSEIIFLQGKPVFYIFLPSTPPYWQIILRCCWQWTPKWQQSESRSHATYFRLSVVLGFYSLLIEFYIDRSYSELIVDDHVH